MEFGRFSGVSYFKGSYSAGEIKLEFESIRNDPELSAELDEYLCELREQSESFFMERYELILRLVHSGSHVHRFVFVCVNALVDIDSETWAHKYFPCELTDHEIDGIKNCILSGIQDEIESSFFF